MEEEFSLSLLGRGSFRVLSRRGGSGSRPATRLMLSLGDTALLAKGGAGLVYFVAFGKALGRVSAALPEHYCRS